MSEGLHHATPEGFVLPVDALAFIEPDEPTSTGQTHNLRLEQTSRSPADRPPR
jgi:hypothetical protein